eukprot:1157985-Pelagomonas_calceolata.AAC.3
MVEEMPPSRGSPTRMAGRRRGRRASHCTAGMTKVGALRVVCHATICRPQGWQAGAEGTDRFTAQRAWTKLGHCVL